MQYLAEAKEDDECADCGRGIGGASLICSACKSLIHLRCSELPKYYLILIGLSRITYTCRRCVKLRAGENYSEHEEEMTRLMGGVGVSSDLVRHLEEASAAGVISSAPPDSQETVSGKESQAVS